MEEMSGSEPVGHSELSGGEHSGSLIQSPVRCYSSMPFRQKEQAGRGSLTRHNGIVQFVFLPQ